MLREGSLTVVLFDDGDDFVVDELPRGLPDQLFFVVQLRVKIDEIHTGESSHTSFLISNDGQPINTLDSHAAADAQELAPLPLSGRTYFEEGYSLKNLRAGGNCLRSLRLAGRVQPSRGSSAGNCSKPLPDPATAGPGHAT